MWVLGFWFFWNITHWVNYNIFNSSSPYYSPWQCTLSNPVYTVDSNWKSYLSADYVWCQGRIKSTPNYDDSYNFSKYIDISNYKCVLTDWTILPVNQSGSILNEKSCDWKQAYYQWKIEFWKTFEYVEQFQAKSCINSSIIRTRWNWWVYQRNDSFSTNCQSEITYDWTSQQNKVKYNFDYKNIIGFANDDCYFNTIATLPNHADRLLIRDAANQYYQRIKDKSYLNKKEEVDRIVNNIDKLCKSWWKLDYTNKPIKVFWNDKEIVILKDGTLTDDDIKKDIVIEDNFFKFNKEELKQQLTIVSKPSDTNTVWTFSIIMRYDSLNGTDRKGFIRTLKIVDLNLSQLTPLLTPLPNADKVINDSNKTDYDNLINQWKNLSATTQTEVDNLVDKIQKAKAKLRFDTTVPTLTFDTLTPSIKVWETFDKFAWLTTTDDIDTTTSQTDWNNKTTVTSSPTLNTNQVGTYTLTYKVKDEHNNEATVTRTLKVNPVSKTQLTTNLNNLRDKLNDSKTVRNNKYNEANTWYNANKNKPTDQNLTQTEVTTLENKANQLLNVLVSDTVAPTIAYTYSANFQQFAQSKEITVGITDNISTNLTWKYALVGKNVTCDNSVTFSNLPTDKKITLNVEANNNKKLCVKAEDDNQNVAYLGSNEIAKIDRTSPVITLTETTKTFKVGEHTTLNLKDNIASVSDNLETTLNANNVVIKNITDTSQPITTSILNNIQVGTYKIEYSLSDTAWNEATKKIYTIIVQENDKTDLNTLISTINTKLSNPKLVNNSAKTDLENYKTTITNAIANRNITQAQIDTIKSNAQAKINALRFDTTAPVITETQQLSFDVGEPLPSGYEFRGLTLSDDNVSATDLRARITANTSSVNPNAVWNYEVSYSLTDNHGNTNSSFKRTIKIKENDKTELNRLINEIENSLGSNLEPSARATVVATLAPHKVISTNVNAKKPQIQQSVTDLRAYKNTLNTQFPEPVFISSITHYTRGQTPMYKNGIRALDKVWGNDISAQITYQDLGDKVVYKVSNGKRIKTLEIPYRDPAPSHSSSSSSSSNSSNNRISWDIGWSGSWASSVFRWGNNNNTNRNTTSSQVNTNANANSNNRNNNTNDIENILNRNSSNTSNTNSAEDILNKQLTNKNNKNNKKNNTSFQEKEHEDAYNWALKNGIIDGTTFPISWIYGNLSRAELATIVSNFAKMQKRKVKFSKEVCSKYKDIWEVNNTILKEGIINSCQYGLIGMQPDGKTQITYFEPNKKLYRYDLSTVLSRMLYGTTYENKTWKGNYWDFHLKNLVDKKIISDANPNIKEIKQWILLMLMRYSQ